MPYTRCAAGKCVFRAPDGTGSDDLQPPRRKKGAPADVALEDLKPHQLVYDVQDDPANKCKGQCRCFIVVQTINTKTKGVVSETLHSPDGDDKDGLTKQDHDKIEKDAKKTGNRDVKFLAACIEMVANAGTGKWEPKSD